MEPDFLFWVSEGGCLPASEKVRILKMGEKRLAQVGKSLESESQNPENGRNKASTGQEKLAYHDMVPGLVSGYRKPVSGYQEPVSGYQKPQEHARVHYPGECYSSFKPLL